MKIDTSEDHSIFISAMENLNAKMKAIDRNFIKSIKEIKANILVSLPEEYLEVRNEFKTDFKSHYKIQ